MQSVFRVGAIALLAAGMLSVAGCNRRDAAEETLAPDPSAPTETPTETPLETPTAAPTPTPPPAGGVTSFDPPQPATLVAQQAGAQINLRSQPSAASSSKGYGLVGDPVKLLRSTQGNDGKTWHYVKFDESGAEGWVRGDFIRLGNIAAAGQTSQAASLQCKGVFDETIFVARFSGDGFDRIDFTNLETQANFGGPLRYQSTNGKGQRVFVGQVSPPAGGAYPAVVTDLSGGSPTPGSRVTLEYAGIPATGTCE